MQKLTDKILNAPRLLRILLAFILAIPFAVLMDRIYPASYFTDSRNFTFMLSIAMGVIMYAVGWHFLIGFGDEGEHRSGTEIYLAISGLALAFTIMLNALEFIGVNA